MIPAVEASGGPAHGLGGLDRLGVHDRRARIDLATSRGAQPVAQPADQRLRQAPPMPALEERLDELWRRAWAILEREHAVVQLGKVVRDVDGQAVVDHAPTLQAIDRLLKIQERRARLLGLDAPTKFEGITVDQIDAEIRRLSQELSPYGQGEGDG